MNNFYFYSFNFSLIHYLIQLFMYSLPSLFILSKILEHINNYYFQSPCNLLIYILFLKASDNR